MFYSNMCVSWSAQTVLWCKEPREECRLMNEVMGGEWHSHILPTSLSSFLTPSIANSLCLCWLHQLYLHSPSCNPDLPLWCVCVCLYVCYFYAVVRKNRRSTKFIQKCEICDCALKQKLSEYGNLSQLVSWMTEGIFGVTQIPLSWRQK